MRRGTIVVAIVLLGGPPSGLAGEADLGAGFRAFQAGEYGQAAKLLAPLVGKGALINQDYALYLLAESEFYGGSPDRARPRFERLAQVKRSRFAEVAPWRVADCLWTAGQRSAAATVYKKLLSQVPARDPKARSPADAPAADPAVARFRLAELESAGGAERSRPTWVRFLDEFPAHPLSEEAARRMGARPGAKSDLAPRERLRRAATLTEGRHWQEALEELGKLPKDLPADLRVERDYQTGMTKFRMRRDYSGAAELLLGVAPKLSGERAAWAAFHGARALSRVDRDDEAIRGYREVLSKHPGSRWAAEAQYLASWLDFNRGRYRDALPGLRETVARFGDSAFADDAAWHLAFAHYLLGEAAQALTALAQYERIAKSAGEGQVRYWRARLLSRVGRDDEARGLMREGATRSPLSHYGLLSRARLREMNDPAGSGPPKLPRRGDTAIGPVNAAAARDPAVARAAELLAAGMEIEAGRELRRDEAGVLKRLGAQQGLAVLFEQYRSGRVFHRAYQLAENRMGAVLVGEPEGAARVVWEAAYPQAFRELVEKHGPAAGNPDQLLYAIMRKESGFSPHEVSYADARGLLQLTPPTGSEMAASAGVPFFPDELFQPETNIRLGAAYVGSLHRKFREQVPLTAAAFNAGARATARWCDQHRGRPLDELVELIAFAQTREYAKRVTGIYAHYRYLYGPTPYELPLTIDTRYAPGESPAAPPAEP